jgi:biotin carboxyl carrier protein
MRRYTVLVNEQQYVLDVRELSAEEFEVHYNGRRIEVELVDDVDLPEAAITPVMTSAIGAAPVATVRHREDTASGGVPPVPTARPAPPNTATVALSHRLTAPMPGAIVSIEVAVGDHVKRGEPLVSLEAMKMVNAIRAPRDVVVAEIFVEKGQMVGFGEPLLRFEE